MLARVRREGGRHGADRGEHGASVVVLARVRRVCSCPVPYSDNVRRVIDAQSRTDVQSVSRIDAQSGSVEIILVPL